MNEVDSYDKSRPTLPPNHYQLVLSEVAKRGNYLDLGMETGQTFFQFYHEFQGDIVGIVTNNQRVEFVKNKANSLLPQQALNRTKILAGDIFKVGNSLETRFDLVTVGQQAAMFGSPDKFFQFAKEKLLSKEGVLALTCIMPKQLEFFTCYDDKENAELKKDFNELQNTLSEYQILPNNPIYNEGIQMRHFSHSNKYEQPIENAMEADYLLQYFRTMPSYIKYIQDDSQIEKNALKVFERKLRERIALRMPKMSSQQSLMRI